MTYIYILGYIVIGLGVAKFFQRWLNKTEVTSTVDMEVFFVFISLWPICVFIRIIAWLIQLWIWFFHLWEEKL